ncbi:MAG: MlaD family protein [Muribaculaceae bacterium]|nr:MlaD family protein [Muribaculaceae bacterium]
MKKIFNKEFIIGICVIVAIVILIFGIDYLKGINLFSPANFYYASYDNVAGLEISSPVTVDGYKVGQVREIQFDYKNPGKIKVLLALNKDLKIPVDTKAMMGTTLMSGNFINLKLGKSAEKIAVGGDIETVENADLMTKLSEEMLPNVNSILPKVDSLLANLNKLAGDPALLASIQRLDAITADIKSTTGALSGTMQRDVPAVMRNAKSISTGLDSVTANLGVLSAQLKTLPLNATMDNVNAVTENLTKFSKQLNDPNSSLGLLMNDPALYNQLNRVAQDVDSLIVDIKKNPKRYISIKLL